MRLLISLLVLLAVVTTSFAHTIASETVQMHQHGLQIDCADGCADGAAVADDTSACAETGTHLQQHRCPHVGVYALLIPRSAFAAPYAEHDGSFARQAFCGTVTHKVPTHPPRALA